MLTKKYNATECEKKWQDFWNKEEVYKFHENSAAEIFSIDTPPPTVNGKIHIGHIFSYSQAEIISRYMRMNGYNVFYPFGFDDNGLPTERLVEYKYKLKASDTTREKFTELCLEETKALEQQFRELFISSGFSCDWSFEYSTISKAAQITSQKSFLDLYSKNKVYCSQAPALWCTECKTAIAQAELESKICPSKFNYLKFYLKSDKEKFITVATTRPELLAACQCIFIHPEDKKNQWLLNQEVKVPLFDLNVPVLADENVEMDKGSGIVMCCTFGDLADLEWFKKYNLEYTEVISNDGTITSFGGKYEGMSVLTARNAIIKDLEKEGYIIKQEDIVHNVSAHERCGTPMEITIKKQWFIDILSKKQEYIDAGNQINWYPPHMKSRYLNWVENIEWDWCISRQRYFGVPFPVWYCKKCGEVVVANVDDLPVNPLVDLPKQNCSCGGSDFEPEVDIMDTWATSSVTPLINLKWYDDQKFMKDMLPMSLRPNAHDIIRTWDFYTIVKSLYHENKLPWKNVMISGHVMSGKNEKISKRKGNSKMEPAELISQYSADAVRIWAATGSLGSDIAFSEGEFVIAQKLINKLWNASKFVIMHLEGFDKKDESDGQVKLNPYVGGDEIELELMDKWIIVAFNKMFMRYKHYMNKYEIGLGFNEVEKFFWSFCDDYIEIIKDRVYKPEIYGERLRQSGLYAAYEVLLGLLKCFAIYIPHITEEIYQNYYKQFVKEKSIHNSQMDKIAIDIHDREQQEILKQGNIVLEIIYQLRRFKSEKNLSLKTELKNVYITVPDEVDIGAAISDIKATCSCVNIWMRVGNAINIEAEI